ncbi:MAG: DUF4258 domain-containing protein [Pseudomonadota bacterium]
MARYPDDEPFPSCLMLSLLRNRAIHVVVGHDRKGDACYIITAYPPAPLLWSADFETRKQP